VRTTAASRGKMSRSLPPHGRLKPPLPRGANDTDDFDDGYCSESANSHKANYRCLSSEDGGLYVPRKFNHFRKGAPIRGSQLRACARFTKVQKKLAEDVDLGSAAVRAARRRRSRRSRGSDGGERRLSQEELQAVAQRLEQELGVGVCESVDSPTLAVNTMEPVWWKKKGRTSWSTSGSDNECSDRVRLNQIIPPRSEDPAKIAQRDQQQVRAGDPVPDLNYNHARKERPAQEDKEAQKRGRSRNRETKQGHHKGDSNEGHFLFYSESSAPGSPKCRATVETIKEGVVQAATTEESEARAPQGHTVWDSEGTSAETSREHSVSSRK